MSEGRCALHQRPPSSTCARCGTFRCDWCEKLTPSWATGLCQQCFPSAAPRAFRFRQVTFGLSLGIAFLATVAFFSLVGLIRQPDLLGAVLFVGSTAATLLIVRFNSRAS